MMTKGISEHIKIGYLKHRVIEDLGWSISEFAKKVGITIAGASEIINNKRRPSRATWKKICRVTFLDPQTGYPFPIIGQVSISEMIVKIILKAYKLGVLKIKDKDVVITDESIIQELWDVKINFDVKNEVLHIATEEKKLESVLLYNQKQKQHLSSRGLINKAQMDLEKIVDAFKKK
jgi:transcriptional regulator with XRE-family HTH domain